MTSDDWRQCKVYICNIHIYNAFHCYCSCCAVSIWILISIDITYYVYELNIISILVSFFPILLLVIINRLIFICMRSFVHDFWAKIPIFYWFTAFNMFFNVNAVIHLPNYVRFQVAVACGTDPASNSTASLTSSISHGFNSISPSIPDVGFGVNNI